MPRLTESESPKYLEIAASLRRDIKSGVLRPGDRLPTFVELRERFSISPSTVERAHALLEREGLIVRGQGRRGTQVVEAGAIPKRNVIGCVGFDFRLTRSFAYWMHLLAGMQDVAQAEGFELLMSGDPTNVSWEKMDGAILHGEYPAEYIQNLPIGMPVVSLMLPYEGIPSVVADDFEGTRRATEHLLQLGHKRIGALMISETPLPKRRLAGYRAALHEAGIIPDPQWICPFITGRRPGMEQGSLRYGGQLDMAEWLDKQWRQNGLTAVLAQNDEVAIGVMDAIHEAGLNVPGDISVIGFDGTEDGRNARPSLTTVTVPLEKIGATGMEVLLRQVREGSVEPNVVTVPARLTVRESTGNAKN